MTNKLNFIINGAKPTVKTLSVIAFLLISFISIPTNSKANYSDYNYKSSNTSYKNNSNTSHGNYKYNKNWEYRKEVELEDKKEIKKECVPKVESVKQVDTPLKSIPSLPFVSTQQIKPITPLATVSKNPPILPNVIPPVLTSTESKTPIAPTTLIVADSNKKEVIKPIANIVGSPKIVSKVVSLARTGGENSNLQIIFSGSIVFLLLVIVVYYFYKKK
jgi:hypothetical protein